MPAEEESTRTYQQNLRVNDRVNICNSAIEKRKRVNYSTLRTEKFSEPNNVKDGVI